MKNLILALCLVSSFSIKLAAQNRNPNGGGRSQNNEMQNLTPEQRAQKDAERAEKKLALTSDQKSKWEQAALEKARANQALQEKMKGATTPEERQGMHSQMQANKDKFNTTVIAFLTPEQKTKYEQMQRDRESRMHNKMNGRKGGSQAPQNTNPE